MRGTQRQVRISAAVVAIAVLSLPTAARADVIDVFSDLAELSPPPLVPTTAPSALGPAPRAIGTSDAGGRGSKYSLRMARPNAVVLLERNRYRSMSALLRVEQQRYSYRAQRTRVRGRAGYLLTRKLGPDSYSLAWVEGGQVYSLGTGTARRISVADLRRTTAGLQRVGGAYRGTHPDPDNGSYALAATTERTISLRVEWTGTCTAPGSSASTAYAGQAEVVLRAQRGDSFSFDIAGNRPRRSPPWEGTVSGTISPSTITLEVRAHGTIDGQDCNSGPLTLTLERQ